MAELPSALDGSVSFKKYQATGNDYVLIDCFQETRNFDWPRLARFLLDRRLGIGADGLLLVKKRPGYDAEMAIYNLDGSIAEMCGNGLRVVVKYVYDYLLNGKERLRMWTGAGLRLARISKVDVQQRAELISIDMGKPIFEPDLIPINLEEKAPGPILLRPLELNIEGAPKSVEYSTVSMGNPHCVIYVPDCHAYPVERIGPWIEKRAALFPNAVNVEFVQIVSDNHVLQRTWERGSGETWSCGTGACAVTVIGSLLGRTKASLTVELLGGKLQIEYRQANESKSAEADVNECSEGSEDFEKQFGRAGSVIMSGPATEVFSGAIQLSAEMLKTVQDC